MRRIRVAYRTMEANVCPRCGGSAARVDLLGDTQPIIKTHHVCRRCLIRTLAFNADHPPRDHGWINLTSGKGMA